MLRRIAPVSAVVLLSVVGCADKPGGTDSDSESDSGGSSTTSVQPTAGGGTDAGATEDGMSDGMSTTVEPGTATEPTTGADAPELMMTCMAVCERLFECVKDLPGSVDECMAGCLDEWGGPECGQVGIDFLECLIGMNCKQLTAYADDDKAGVCAGPEDAAEAVCGGGSSACSMNGGGGMNECSVGRECDGSIEDFQCDGELCTCVVDGVAGESCMVAGVCGLSLEEQGAAAQDCCGWVWS